MLIHAPFFRFETGRAQNGGMDRHVSRSYNDVWAGAYIRKRLIFGRRRGQGVGSGRGHFKDPMGQLGPIALYTKHHFGNLLRSGNVEPLNYYF